MKVFDVIIVGGGPAGIAAAQIFNKNKINYCLIDKCKFPREKLCGGGLTSKSIKILNNLEIKINNIKSKKVKDGLLVTKNANKEVTLDDGIIMIDRKEFDNVNIKEIVKDNLFAEENIKNIDNNILTTDKDSYEFKYIIFADGINGYSRKLINNRKFGFCVEYESKELTEKTVLDFNAIKYGYGWIFPKKDHTTIGLGNFIDKKCDYVKLLEDFGKKYNFTINKKDIKGYHIPTFSQYVYNNSIINNQYILVGDAASLVNPISGEGIYYALVSGKNAALSIVECLKNNGDLKEIYFKKNEGIYNSLKKMSVLSKHLYSYKKNILIKLGMNNKKIMEKIKRVFG